MTTYAQVVDGIVRRTFQPDFPDMPLDQQMAPEIAAQMVKLTAIQAKKVEAGWLHDGASFTPPPAPEPLPPPPQPTKAELLAEIEALMTKVQAIPSDDA